MASTSYNTLTLSEEEPRKARSSAVYVVLGLAVVAMAGAAAVFATGAAHTQTAVNAEYSAKSGSMASCDSHAEDFLVSLPKYDPDLNKKDAGRSSFYNACYYSFRCCTTSTASCMQSNNLKASCLECLKGNAPRMVRPWCLDYALETDDMLKDPLYNAVFAQKEKDNGAPQFTIDSLKTSTFDSSGSPVKEPMPKPFDETTKYKAAQADGTCWPQPGAEDLRAQTFAEQCFEVISWCNLLCPRDGQNSNQHAMCKHCVIMDFQEQDAPIDIIKDTAVVDAKAVQEHADALETKAMSEFTGKYRKAGSV